MKRKTFFLMFLSASALAAGCGNGVIRELPAMELPARELPARELPAEETKFSFDDLQGLEFIFSSGAGAWGTTLQVRWDGSFAGTYSDSNMGETGPEYPGGTQYRCDFSGQFTEPEKVNDYTYSVEIAAMDYVEPAGSEEIKDGILYRYTDVYGLSRDGEILIYLPGAPLEELSPEFRSWIGYYDLSGAENEALPFYALNNAAEQQGFGSSNVEEAR